MITHDERKSFGWLGRPPQEVVAAGPRIVAMWKRLAHDAAQVARMPNTGSKLNQAKQIQERYRVLMEIATNESVRGNDGRDD